MDTQTEHLYRANAPITSIEAAESIDVTHLEKIVLDVVKYYTREAASACYDGCISDDVRKRCKNEHGIVRAQRFDPVHW